MLGKIKHIMFAKKITNKQEREKNMEEMTKKTLGEMIGEMLQTEDLNTSQMQIIDLLCKINESNTIKSRTEYYYGNTLVDRFEDFVVENDIEIWGAFYFVEGGEIAKLVLLNTKKLGEGEVEQDTRIVVNFKYVNGVPKYCYVRILYSTKDEKGDIVKSMFNWNEEVAACTFGFNEVEMHDKKSDFFITLTLD